jgi:hypothetical protein
MHRDLRWLVLWLAMMPVAAHAGGIDQLMNQRLYSSAEINLNLGANVARLYEEDKPDSVGLILQEWEDLVGYNGMIQKFDALWRIQNGEFDPEEIDGDFYENIIAYRRWAEWSERIGDAWDRGEIRDLWRDYGYSTRFEEVTRWMAEDLSLNEEPDSDAQLVALAYQNQFAVLGRRLRSPATLGTAMRREHDAALRRFFDAPEVYLTLQAGYWKGGGGLAVMGEHPIIGLSMRRVSPRLYLALTMSMQPGDTPSDFQFEVDRRAYRTRRFIGLEGFLDVGTNLAKTERHTLSAFVGPGFSGFRGFYGNDDPPAAENFFAPAISFGMTYRWRYSGFSSGSIVVNTRYTMGNYEGGDDSEFHGNAFALEVGWGASEPDRYPKLRYYR